MINPCVNRGFIVRNNVFEVRIPNPRSLIDRAQTVGEEVVKFISGASEADQNVARDIALRAEAEHALDDLPERIEERQRWDCARAFAAVIKYKLEQGDDSYLTDMSYLEKLVPEKPAEEWLGNRTGEIDLGDNQEVSISIPPVTTSPHVQT